MNYMIGCNYWNSKYGTEMWANWDPDCVDKDFEALSKYGVRYLRVFPNWRDFQPVHALRAWRGMLREYRIRGREYPTNEFWIDEQQITNFKEFTRLAKKHNIKLIVSIMTGWMSGRLFVPPAVEGLNHICDAESLKWQIRFVRGFVHYLKDDDQIIAWDLGNECNCLGQIQTEAQAYLWTASIRNAIKAEDSTRIIMSGMHSLSALPTWDNWTIMDHGELCDMMSPHPYPSATIGGDVNPLNSLRTTLLPTMQVEYYKGVGEKPAMIQETGSNCNMLGNEKMAADFARVNMYSGWANGSKGYLWWCAHEQTELQFPPYIWSMVENELGILRLDRSPKPVALAMKEVDEVLNALPELPEKQYDAVCMTTLDEDKTMQVFTSVCVLSKQAGIETQFVRMNKNPLPDAKLYILPSIHGWACIFQDTYQALCQKVREGANLLVSTWSGYLTDFENIFGLRSNGLQQCTTPKKVDFNGTELEVKHCKQFLLEPITAEVLAQDDNGNVIFARNRLGKGYVYFLNFPLERNVYDSEVFLSNGTKYPYYKIYQQVAQHILEEKPLRTDEPDIGITLHPVNDKEYIATAINYTPTAKKCKFRVKDGVFYEVLYGSDKEIPSCDMTVLRLKLQ